MCGVRVGTGEVGPPAAEGDGTASCVEKLRRKSAAGLRSTLALRFQNGRLSRPASLISGKYWFGASYEDGLGALLLLRELTRPKPAPFAPGRYFGSVSLASALVLILWIRNVALKFAIQSFRRRRRR